MRGLYVITDPSLIASSNLVNAVSQAITGGAKMVQYRNKAASAQQKLWEANDLVSLCTGVNVPLIINDDIDLALKTNAAGVHLGQADTGIKDARKLLGSRAIIGVSCHNKIDLALDAQDAGASYVAFGRFFASSTKPEAVEAKVELLLTAKEKIDIPIVAIGGITQDNCTELLKAGADMLAVIHGVFAAESITNSAKLISNQIDNYRVN